VPSPTTAIENPVNDVPADYVTDYEEWEVSSYVSFDGTLALGGAIKSDEVEIVRCISRLPTLNRQRSKT
jgi:hypothetical protein